MVRESALSIIRDSLGQMKQPVRLVAFTSDVNCDRCPEVLDVARAIKAASAKISLETYDMTMDRDKSKEYGVLRVPTLAVQGQNWQTVKFSGAVEGVSLILLLDAINGISRGRTWFPDKITGTLKMLEKEVDIQVILDTDCTLCRPVAETAVGLALTNKLVSTEIIVADDYPELLSKMQVKILPFTLFGPKLTMEGHVSEGEFLEQIFKAEGQKAAALQKRCMVCGGASSDLICTSCKTKIQAEAVEHKHRDEKLRETGTIVESRKHG